MTDNEIIKALECCADEMGCIKGCPCFNPKSKGSHCTVSKKLELEKLTIDLINRLRAENERLQKNLEEAHLDIKEQRAGIESLEAENKLLIDRNCELSEKGDKAVITFVKSKNQIRAEARKEFAYKLKQIPNIAAYKWEIDNLEKEMSGDV